MTTAEKKAFAAGLLNKQMVNPENPSGMRGFGNGDFPQYLNRRPSHGDRLPRAYIWAARSQAVIDGYIVRRPKRGLWIPLAGRWRDHPPSPR